MPLDGLLRDGTIFDPKNPRIPFGDPPLPPIDPPEAPKRRDGGRPFNFTTYANSLTCAVVWGLGSAAVAGNMNAPHLQWSLAALAVTSAAVSAATEWLIPRKQRPDLGDHLYSFTMSSIFGGTALLIGVLGASAVSPRARQLLLPHRPQMYFPNTQVRNQPPVIPRNIAASAPRR